MERRERTDSVLNRRGCPMSPVLKVALMVIALAGAPAGYVFYNAALSPETWVYEGGKATNWKDDGYHGAPAPIAGASLPVLAVGFGVYRLVRRRRKAN